MSVPLVLGPQFFTDVVFPTAVTCDVMVTSYFTSYDTRPVLDVLTVQPCKRVSLLYIQGCSLI